jgi:hypothetical protein
MKITDVPTSGKSGKWVYYMDRGKQRRRRWVKPKDPRTPAQLRLRAVFGAASRTWSVAELLTDEEQDAWIAKAAKTRSRPRLDQSGTLTGEQYFVG